MAQPAFPLMAFAMSLGVAGCSGTAGQAPGNAQARHRPASEPTGDAATGGIIVDPTDLGHAAPESLVRFEVDRLFRASGFVIQNDVLVSLGDGELAVDGYDRQRGVGYEYIDPRELTLLETKALREVGGEFTILILTPGPLDKVLAKARTFVASRLEAQSR